MRIEGTMGAAASSDLAAASGDDRRVHGTSDGEALLPSASAFDGAFSSADLGAALAKLVIEMSSEQRDRAKAVRSAEERAQEAADRQQLAAMRDEADDVFAAGLVSGGATFAAGGLTFASGAALAKSGGEASSKQWAGGSEGTAGAGKVASAAFQREADRHGVDAADAEQRAERHRRAAEDARADVAAAETLVDRAVGFYEQFQAARAEARQAAFLRA